MWRLAVIAVALTGCDALFQIDRLPADARSDVQDGGPYEQVACASVPTYQDTFDDMVNPPCTGWGILDPFMTTVTNAKGALTITPAPQVKDTRGGCESGGSMPFTPSGIFTEVTEPASGPSEFMELCAYDALVAKSAWCAQWTTAKSIHYGTRDVAFDASLTRWVRIRPSADRTAVLAETSPDTVTWSLLDSIPEAAPADVKLSLLMGTYAAEAAPSTARFDTLDICP